MSSFPVDNKIKIKVEVGDKNFLCPGAGRILENILHLGSYTGKYFAFLYFKNDKVEKNISMHLQEIIYGSPASVTSRHISQWEIFLSLQR